MHVQLFFLALLGIELPYITEVKWGCCYNTEKPSPCLKSLDRLQADAFQHTG